MSDDLLDRMREEAARNPAPIYQRVASRTFTIDSESWYSNIAMPAGAEDAISIAVVSGDPLLPDILGLQFVWKRFSTFGPLAMQMRVYSESWAILTEIPQLMPWLTERAGTIITVADIAEAFRSWGFVDDTQRVSPLTKPEDLELIFDKYRDGFYLAVDPKKVLLTKPAQITVEFKDDMAHYYVVEDKKDQ